MAPNRCQLSVPAAGLPPVLAVCVIAVTQAAESATQVLRRYSCSQDARVPLLNFGNGSKAAATTIRRHAAKPGLSAHWSALREAIVCWFRLSLSLRILTLTCHSRATAS